MPIDWGKIKNAAGTTTTPTTTPTVDWDSVAKAATVGKVSNDVKGLDLLSSTMSILPGGGSTAPSETFGDVLFGKGAI